MSLPSAPRRGTLSNGMAQEDGLRIDRRTSVRQVLARYPGAAAIFEKYGIMGCGGPTGPDEPLAFFARVHRVDPDQLIAELRCYVEAASAPPLAEACLGPALPLALLPIGLAFLWTLIGLPLGGALALLAAAGSASGANWTAAVQAHGYIQLFGWLGLFIIGMALHILPRFKARPLALERLRLPLVLLWCAAVVARTAAPVLPGVWALSLVIAAAAGGLAAAALFTAMVGMTLVVGRRESYDAFLVAACAWPIVGSALFTTGAGVAWREGVPYLPRDWDTAALDVMAYGFVLPFVFGASLRVVPFFMSLPPPAERPLPTLLALHSIGLALLTARDLWPAFGGDALGALAAAGAGAVLLAAVGVAIALRVFSPSRPSDVPDHETVHRKFIRAAYGWLLAGAAANVWLAVGAALGREPGWLEAGAARHILLLGFATQMVFGIGLRALPVFVGERLYSRRLADVTFPLLNVAAVTRALPPLVATGGASVVWPHIAGAGLPATLALALFAYNLMRTFRRAARRSMATAGAVTPQEVRKMADERGGPITADMTVAQVIERVPGALQLLISRGFTPLADPNMRTALAPTITLKGACEMRGVDLEALLRDLNEPAKRQEEDRRE